MKTLTLCLALCLVATSAFAGLSGDDAKRPSDAAAVLRAYGSDVTARAIVDGTRQVAIPAAAQSFVRALGRGVQTTTRRR